LPTIFCGFQHFFAEIQTDSFRATLREREGNVAGAAAQIERAVAIFYLSEFHDAAFPNSVQSETLQIIDQIVTARDGCKEVIDFCGALFAGRVKYVAHAGI
jgi:hypothetical protein